MKSIICASLLICWNASRFAFASDESAFARCRQIAESPVRLACYDAVPLSKDDDSVSPRGINRSGTERSVASRVDTTSVAAIHPAGNPTQRFGLPVAATTAHELEQIESVIPGRFDGWLARGRIRLTNGQLWEVSDGSEAAYDLHDLKVTITRGVSGTFFMQIEGVSQTPRVRRIE